MKNTTKHFSPFLFLVHIPTLLTLALAIGSAEARTSPRHSRLPRNPTQRHHKPRDHGKSYPYPPTPNNVFNVMSYGAIGDSVTDDSDAIVAAWRAACLVSGATVEIPSGSKLLIGPVTLKGPCMPGLALRIDGSIIAPSEVGSWPKSSLFQWINLKWLQNFTIQGSGVVDGRGHNWWSSNFPTDDDRDGFQVGTNVQMKRVPSMKPTALRFYASYNVTVRDITIMNSPLVHLKFDNSRGVTVDNVTITSPENSVNTDGIHLQNTREVEIQHSNIASGDDCISIQTGCSNIHIHHINCGPGHGISLGGLGKDRSIACVSDIVVEDISMTNTMYGARIKTWQGGIGAVKNVTFSRIDMSNVRVPVMIDQFYCDKGRCKNQTGGVAISNVRFTQITGTYVFQPVRLACNNDVPCVNVDLIGIQLDPTPSKWLQSQHAICSNSYGISQGPLSPSSIDQCLRRGTDLVRRVERSHERICDRVH